MFNNNIQFLPIPLDVLAREDMTLSEKIVYSFLRYRYNLSVTNDKFTDEQGVFIFFEQKDIMKAAAMAQRTVEKAMIKLVDLGLIQREKYRRTFKIYIKPYEVDERYIIPNKDTEAAQDAFKGVDPSNNIPNDENGVQDANISDLGNVDKSVNNDVDNLGIDEEVNNPIDAKNTPITNICVKNTPISQIDAKNTPKNNTIYKNTKEKNKDNNYNNFTLLKGHKPKYVIDQDIYNAFTNAFGTPNHKIKTFINELIANGMDRNYILACIEDAAINKHTWNYVKNNLTSIAPTPMVELTQEQLAAREKSISSFKPFNYRLATEPSEIEDADQVIFL